MSPPASTPLGLRHTLIREPAHRALSTFGASLDDDLELAQVSQLDLPVPGGDDPDEGAVIGVGGTSEVRLSYQRSLGRWVAVKQLRSERRSPGGNASLLREARISALLEHPNIVPVHDVTIDGAGTTAVTMRRVAGDSWGSVLEDPAREAAVVGEADRLEWHLRVLLQVGNAVRFAHRHSVVHRDLKPDNVMIGAFGEVYVVDWGIAVTTSRTAHRFLPHGDDQPWPAGTPAYMAPEQLGEGVPITERTDIFLLGSLLFSILTRRPPYVGDVDMVLLARIRAVEPGGALHGPAGLVTLCRWAMSADPADRPATVEVFLEGVERWLRERGAEALVAQAGGQLAALLEQARAVSSDAGRLGLYGLYGQCRFGFDQALRIEPGRADAREGREAAISAMLRYELGRADAAAAAVLLADLDPAPAELVTQVASLRAHAAADASRAARLRRDHDPSVRRKTRLAALGALLVLWTVLPILGFPLQGLLFGGPSWVELAIIDLSFFVLVAVGGLLSWGSWATTAFNRWLVGGVGIAIGGQVLLDFGSWLAGIPPAAAHALHLFLWATVVGYGSLVLDRRMAIPAMGFALGWWIAARWPEMIYPVFSVSNALLLAVVVWMWGRPGARAA